jgi:hypothetical protein
MRAKQKNILPTSIGVHLFFGWYTLKWAASQTGPNISGNFWGMISVQSTSYFYISTNILRKKVIGLDPQALLRPPGAVM